jgi:hypothetical protein
MAPIPPVLALRRHSWPTHPCLRSTSRTCASWSLTATARWMCSTTTRRTGAWGVGGWGGAMGLRRIPVGLVWVLGARSTCWCVSGPGRADSTRTLQTRPRPNRPPTLAHKTRPPQGLPAAAGRRRPLWARQYADVQRARQHDAGGCVRRSSARIPAGPRCCGPGAPLRGLACRCTRRHRPIEAAPAHTPAHPIPTTRAPPQSTRGLWRRPRAVTTRAWRRTAPASGKSHTARRAPAAAAAAAAGRRRGSGCGMST